MANWMEMLEAEVLKNKDNINNMVCTIHPEDLRKEFEDGFGLGNGKPFTAWSERFVYSSDHYDGAACVVSAKCRPCCRTVLFKI